jgi:DNA adenine methylase
LNKERSQIEVYNDLDGDLVQFFETARDHHEALIEWLQWTKYSRELYDRYAEDFYAGERPEDPVERAGRFYFLRFTQFSGRYDLKAGFSTRKSHHSPAATYAAKQNELWRVSERFDGVTIEHMGWDDCIDQYDGPRTLWYFDPPYVDAGDSLYSHESEFDHSEFADALRRIEGDWICSYTDLPPGLDEYHVVLRETWHHMAQGHGSGGKTADERIVMNFDPDETDSFGGSNRALAEFATDGGSR